MLHFHLRRPDAACAPTPTNRCQHLSALSFCGALNYLPCRLSESTWKDPSTNVSLNTSREEPSVVSTATAPGPPFFTNNVKGTALPAPSPVTSAVPVSVAVSRWIVAPVIWPV